MASLRAMPRTGNRFFLRQGGVPFDLPSTIFCLFCSSRICYDLHIYILHSYTLTSLVTTTYHLRIRRYLRISRSPLILNLYYIYSNLIASHTLHESHTLRTLRIYLIALFVNYFISYSLLFAKLLSQL